MSGQPAAPAAGDIDYWIDQIQAALDAADLTGAVAVEVDDLVIRVGLSGRSSAAAHRDLAHGLDDRGFEVLSQPGAIPVRIDATADRLDDPLVGVGSA